MPVPASTQQHTALRLLHYWWPPVLGWSLAMIVARTHGRTADPQGLLALVAGILAAYSLDRAVDRTQHNPGDRLHALLLVTGSLATITCGAAALQLPTSSAMIVPLLGIVAGLYPRLKRRLLTKLVLLPAVWLTAIVALPFPDGSWSAWRTLLHPVGAPIFLLVGAGCLLCDLKDADADQRTGVRSLPALFGATATARIAASTALAGAALALGLGETELAVGGILLVAAATRPDLVAVEPSGPLLVDVLLSVPGFLVVCGEL